MDKGFIKTLIAKLIDRCGGGKWLLLTNVLTLAALCVVAKHYHVVSDIKAKMGLEQKLSDDYWA